MSARVANVLTAGSASWRGRIGRASMWSSATSTRRRGLHPRPRSRCSAAGHGGSRGRGRAAWRRAGADRGSRVRPRSSCPPHRARAGSGLRARRPWVRRGAGPRRASADRQPEMGEGTRHPALEEGCAQRLVAVPDVSGLARLPLPPVSEEASGVDERLSRPQTRTRPSAGVASEGLSCGPRRISLWALPPGIIGKQPSSSTTATSSR